jgi:hypothetical protein
MLDLNMGTSPMNVLQIAPFWPLTVCWSQRALPPDLAPLKKTQGENLGMVRKPASI